MSSRNAMRAFAAFRAMAASVVLGLVTWSCQVAEEERVFLDVRADSSWTAFDPFSVVLADEGGTPFDTLFMGKLSSPDQLKRLPAPGYDGRRIKVILTGYKNGKPAKIETRDYDGRTQTETGPASVVIVPEDTGSSNGSPFDLKPDTLRLYVGGPSSLLAPAGAAWAGQNLSWSSSETKVAAVQGGTVVATGPGTAFIRAQAGQYRDSSRVTVVKDVPVLDAGADTTVLVNSSLAFQVRVRQEFGGIAAFKWSLDGDTAWDDSASGLPAQVSVAETAKRTFAQEGRIVLRFLVRDGEGNEAVAARGLTVSSKPPPVIADLAPADTTISINDSVPFAAKATSSAPLASYGWDFNGDGKDEETGTVSGAAATVKAGKRFAAAGIYHVTLRVTDQNGSSQSRQATVTAETDLPAADAGKDTTVEPGSKANLHGVATDKLGKVAKTEWKIGGGNFAAAPPETTITAPSAGGASIDCILRVTDDDGGQASDTMTVTVKAAADAGLKTLVLSSGPVTPIVSATTLAYTSWAPESVSTLKVTATAASPGAQISVNGTVVAAGVPSPAIALKVGTNVITLIITAQDNVTRKTYTITVDRLDQTPPPMPIVMAPDTLRSGILSWTWKSGGGDGIGVYRYRLNDSDLSNVTKTTTSLSYQAGQATVEDSETLYVQECDSSGNWSAAGHATIVVRTGPPSWYKFDGDLKDAGLNANHGTATGGLAYAADHNGAANKALDFKSGNLSIATGSARYALGSHITVSAWIKMPPSDGDNHYFVISPEGGIGMFSTLDSVGMTISTPSTENAHCAIPANTWTHITGTYDGTDIRIYRNGALQATKNHPGYISGDLSGMVFGTLNGTFWNGALDDVRFYNRVLSPAEITALAKGAL